MQIKSIIAAAAIALIAGVGSVSADELSVADTAVNTGAPFAMLDGIATEQMSVQEMAATRGAGREILFGTSDGIFVCCTAGSPSSTEGQTGRWADITFEIVVTNAGSY